MEQELINQDIVQPQVDNTAEAPAIEAPPIESGPGEGGGKGSTSTTKDLTPKYEADSKHIAAAHTTYTTRLNDFLVNAFTTAGISPVVNGKTITNMQELSKYTNNPKTSEALYNQALKIFDDPSLEDKLGGLMVQQKSVDDAFHYFTEADNQVNKGMKYAGQVLDSKMKTDMHSGLFNEDGSLKSRAEYEQVLAHKRAEYIENWEKQNPKPANSAMFWQRTDMPNPMQGKVMYDPTTGKSVPLDPRPKMMDSQEGWGIARGVMLSGLSKQFDKFSYDQMTKRLQDEYNKNERVSRVSAKAEGIKQLELHRGANAGGAKAAVDVAEYPFNFEDENIFDRTGDGKYKVKENISNVVDFLKKIQNTEGAVFTSGAIQGDGPSSDNANSRAVVKMLYNDIYDVLKSNGTKGLGSVPIGKLTFQAVVGGNENMQAYNIRLNPAYFDKSYYGSKDAPGPIKADKDILADGITVYVPKESALKSGIKVSIDNHKMNTVSMVEGAISLNPDGKYTRVVPNGLTYSIQKTPNSYTLSGYSVRYNPETAHYDTSALNNQQFKLKYGLDVDLDQIDHNMFQAGLSIYKDNMRTKKLVLGVKGVKDPKQLAP